MAISDFTQIAFSNAVKKLQEKWGVRSHNEELGKKQAARGLTKITPALAEWLEACRSFYMASASLDGQPYMQHRGGPAGFIKTLDEQHIAFADYPGNKQYISLGNISENPRIQIFIMDYAQKQRVKIWGKAEMVEREQDEALVQSLVPAKSTLFPKRAIRIKIDAWDMNCPAHIPELYPADQVAEAITKLQSRIAELEEEIAHLKNKSKKGDR